MAKPKAKVRATVTVTKRAIMQRINRALAKQGELLRANRSSSYQHDLGHYYVIDLRLNAVVGKDVDLTELGKELGVLKDWESVEAAA